MSSMPLDNPAIIASSKRPSVPSTPPQTTRRVHRVSTSRSRSNSRSPRKRQAHQPLHIRMRLTETQMDKIADAFTTKVRDSPATARQRAANDAPTRTRQGQQIEYHVSSGGYDDAPEPPSSTFSELMPRLDEPTGNEIGNSHPGIANQHMQYQPMPIQFMPSSQSYSSRHAPAQGDTDNQVSVSPLSLGSEKRWRRKVAVGQEHPQNKSHDQVSPLHPNDMPGANGWPAASEGDINRPVLDMDQAWMREATPPEVGASVHPPRVQSLPQRTRRSKSTSEGLQQIASEVSATYICQPHSSARPPRPSAAPPPQSLSHTASQWFENQPESPPFSPLALYFRGPDFPSSKKGEKTLIGHNGWLERPEKVANGRDKKSPQKKTGIIEGIKKIAREVTAEFNYGHRRSQSSAKEAASSSMPFISLNAREQSLLFCELEFHLTTALNDYISTELDRGHLVPDNLKRISDWWTSHGRPRVIGFRYDLETQLELVGLHVDDFNFYGRRQNNRVEICGLLDAMKTNARQMRIRTFCQPDSVIAKQLLDSQSLFNLINVSNVQQVALAEIAQFFKVIVEREHDNRRQCRDGEVRKTRFPQARNSTDGDFEWPQQRRSVKNQTMRYDFEEDPIPYAR